MSRKYLHEPDKNTMMPVRQIVTQCITRLYEIIKPSAITANRVLEVM